MASTLPAPTLLGRYPWERVRDEVKVYEPNTRVCILTIKGGLSERFLQLMEQDQPSMQDYNCFAAADYLRGVSQTLNYPQFMPKLGEPVRDVLEKTRGSAGPLLVQIVGDTNDPAESGVGRKWKRDVAIHAGILVGSPDLAGLFVLEKDGRKDLRVTPWTEMHGRYFPGTKTRIGKEVRIADLGATR